MKKALAILMLMLLALAVVGCDLVRSGDRPEGDGDDGEPPEAVSMPAFS